MLILCDLQMPRLDGVEFVKRLRRLPPFHETFTVAITGLCGPLDVAATREAGFDGHLEKPMSAEMLARVLHRAGWTGALTPGPALDREGEAGGRRGRDGIRDHGRRAPPAHRAMVPVATRETNRLWCGALAGGMPRANPIAECPCEEKPPGTDDGSISSSTAS